MKSYFPKLDSIRFYAFLIVFISHTFFNSRNDLLKSFPSLLERGERYFAHGEVGVQIFFMLSGFLIAYLSMRQVQKTGTFSILHFFKKRVLRIWPLYFLVIGLSYVLYLIQGKALSLGCTSMFLYFFGNICLAEGMPDVVSTITISPLWSVSIEEQFYIVFPFLFLLGIVLYKRYRKVSKWLAVSAIFVLYVFALHSRFIHAENWSYISYSAVSALPSILSGILLALGIVMYENAFKKIAAHKKTVSIIAVFSFLIAFYIKFAGSLGAALYILPIFITTACLILLSVFDEVDEQPKPVSRWAITTQYLGRISYGLYVYHMISIVGINYVYTVLSLTPTYLPNIYMKIISTFLITIFMAHMSYRYIEKWFLKFK